MSVSFRNIDCAHFFVECLSRIRISHMEFNAIASRFLRVLHQFHEYQFSNTFRSMRFTDVQIVHVNCSPIPSKHVWAWSVSNSCGQSIRWWEGQQSLVFAKRNFYVHCTQTHLNLWHQNPLPAMQRRKHIHHQNHHPDKDLWSIFHMKLWIMNQF